MAEIKTYKLGNGFIAEYQDGVKERTVRYEDRFATGENLKAAILNYRLKYIKPYEKRLQKNDTFNADEIVDIFKIVTAPVSGCPDGVAQFLQEEKAFYDDVNRRPITFAELVTRLPDVKGKLQIVQWVNDGCVIKVKSV